MYCGSCLRDNALARALLSLGHDVTLAPVYTPTRVDVENVSQSRVLFGGVSVRANGKAELGYWIGTQYWGQGFATEAARAVIDHAFSELGWDELQSGARISNPASRRVLEKCGFQWSGVGLYRIRSIASSAPFDRFRLERGIWSSLKDWGKAA